jgi:Cd2+/Zn2+-exporting ATPase
MGAAGTDVALETADVALMTDRLDRLPEAVDLGRRTERIILQNVVISLGLKAVVFVLAVANLATLWMAVAADMGASMVVIANALRLLGAAPPHGDDVSAPDADQTIDG